MQKTKRRERFYYRATAKERSMTMRVKWWKKSMRRLKWKSTSNSRLAWSRSVTINSEISSLCGLLLPSYRQEKKHAMRAKWWKKSMRRLKWKSTSNSRLAWSRSVTINSEISSLCGLLLPSYRQEKKHGNES